MDNKACQTLFDNNRRVISLSASIYSNLNDKISTKKQQQFSNGSSHEIFVESTNDNNNSKQESVLSLTTTINSGLFGQFDALL